MSSLMGKQSAQKFRETLWFKKGELDALDAQATDDEVRPDVLPIEERYLDDGSVSGSDRVAFSVSTGTTSCLPVMVDEVASDDRGDDLRALVGEMKRGRRRVFAALGASVAAVTTVLLLYVV